MRGNISYIYSCRILDLLLRHDVRHGAASTSTRKASVSTSDSEALDLAAQRHWDEYDETDALPR